MIDRLIFNAQQQNASRVLAIVSKPLYQNRDT